MKKNHPPALIVLELPDYKKRRSKLDLPLLSLAAVLIALIVYGAFGEIIRSFSFSKSSVISYGTEVIADLETSKARAFEISELPYSDNT